MALCEHCGQIVSLKTLDPEEKEICLCKCLAPITNPGHLIEEDDFYIEKGLLVFTEKYHLKKGHCCHNNCRHCPYC